MVGQVSVLIIAPPGRWRDSLRVLLQASRWVTTVSEADTLQDGQTAIATTPPRLVIADAGLSDGDPWLMVRQLKQKHSPVRCFVLAHTHDQERLARAAGADAVLQAGFPADVLFDALAKVGD